MTSSITTLRVSLPGCTDTSDIDDLWNHLVQDARGNTDFSVTITKESIEGSDSTTLGPIVTLLAAIAAIKGPLDTAAATCIIVDFVLRWMARKRSSSAIKIDDSANNTTITIEDKSKRAEQK